MYVSVCPTFVGRLRMFFFLCVWVVCVWVEITFHCIKLIKYIKQQSVWVEPRENQIHIRRKLHP